MKQTHLEKECTRLGLLAYKDPECRNRWVIVDGDHDLEDLKIDVANPRGMQGGGAHFIGTQSNALAFIWGVEVERDWIAPAKKANAK